MRGVGRAAAGQECSKGNGMIVSVPALQISPIDGLILRVRKYDRRALLRVRRQRKTKHANEQNEQAQAPAGRQRRPHRRTHCPASVATTFQFGSREAMSRAKVHTSVTSVTFSALPSITVPARSRVAETSFDTKRPVIGAVERLRSSAAVIVEASIETKRVSTVSLRRSRSVIAASKPSKTSRDNRLRNCLRSPPAKAVTIIS